MGSYHTISTTSGGSYTPPPDAPNILDDGTTVASAYYEPYGHDWNRGLTATLHLPTSDGAYAHLFEIQTIATNGAGDSLTFPSVYAPFSGSTLTVRSIPTPVSAPYPAETWTLKFRCINDANKATASPTTRTVTTTAPSVSSVTVVETGPRITTNIERAVATTLTVTPTLSANLGGSSAIQYVTVWTKYAWGDPDKGPDPITTRKGIFPITGLTTAIVLTGENQVYITTLSSTVLTVYVALGAWDGTTIPASAAAGTYTMSGPAAPPSAGSWISGANFTGLSSALKYYTIGGGAFGFKFGTLGFTAGFSTHPTLRSVRCYVQNGKWNGSTWTARPDDSADKAFCDVQVTQSDANTIITVTGDSVTVAPVWPWSVRISTDAYPDVRIHLDVIPTAGSIVTQAAFSGQTSPCSEIIFSSDGQYAYIQPSLTKALATASPWDPATLGDRLGLVGGKATVVTPLAFNVSSPTAFANYTTEGGLPKWYLTGQFVLPTPYTNINNVHIVATAAGIILPELLVIQEAQFGISFTLVGNTLFYQTPTQPRDTVTFNYTLQFWVDNADGVRTPFPASTSVTVTGTAAPFSTTAPPAPVITTAMTSSGDGPIYVRNGHSFSVGFKVSFVAPTNLTGVHYSVRVSRVNAAGQRSIIETMYWDSSGPFVPGTAYGFTGNAVDDIPAAAQTWGIEFLAINPDSVANPSPNIFAVTVAPNTVSAVGGAEGAAYIEAGQGSKTHVTVTGTIGTANGPGVSVASPQALTAYFSADNGNTWFGLDWVDAATTSFSFSFELWRPTDVVKPSCKVAVAIGAWNWPDGTFRSPGPSGPVTSLPASASISSPFTVALVGAPSATACTAVSVLPRTATGAALYQGVTIGITGDKVVYWGVQPGMTFTNPNYTDPEFFYARFECYVVQAGTPAPGAGEVIAPADQGGTKTYHSGAKEFIPGAANVCTDIDGWEFNPVGSNFTVLRVRLIAFSRSGQSTVQAVWTGTPPNTGIVYSTDHTYCDITFGAPPTSQITSGLSPSSIGSGMYIDTAGKLQLTGAPLLVNGSFEEGALGGTPSGWSIGGGQIGTVTTVVNPLSNATNPSARCVALSGSHSSIVQTFPCKPGDMFHLSDLVYASGANGTMRCGLIWLDFAQGFITITEAPQIGAPGAWTAMAVSGTAPINTAYVQVFLSTANNTSGTWYVDNADLEATGHISVGNGMGFDTQGNLVVSANSEFSFVAGKLIIAGVDFSKGFNGFTVGNSVPQITISPGGVPMGWIGSDSASGFSGAWFKRVMIGGTSPANAPIIADASGNVAIPGTLITGSIVSAQIAVQNITGWNLANITIGSGVTFVGSNYTVRLNQLNVNGAPVAIDSSGPISATDFVANLVDGTTHRGQTCTLVFAPGSFSFNGFPGKTTLTFQRGLITQIT